MNSNKSSHLYYNLFPNKSNKDSDKFSFCSSLSNKSYLETETKYGIVVFGKTGSGKSSILNKLAGQQNLFPEGSDLNSTTLRTHAEKVKLIDEGKTTCLLVDTPGFYDTEKRCAQVWKDLVDFFKATKEGFNLILFVLSLKEEKFDNSIQIVLELLQIMFGKIIFSRTIFVLTHGNEFNDKTKQKHITRYYEGLPSLLSKIGFVLKKDDFIIYEHEDEKSVNLREFIEKKLLPSKKERFEILKELDCIDFDIENPIAVLKKLAEQSKIFNEFQKKISSLMKENFELKKLNPIRLFMKDEKFSCNLI